MRRGRNRRYAGWILTKKGGDDQKEVATIITLCTHKKNLESIFSGLGKQWHSQLRYNPKVYSPGESWGRDPFKINLLDDIQNSAKHVPAELTRGFLECLMGIKFSNEESFVSTPKVSYRSWLSIKVTSNHGFHWGVFTLKVLNVHAKAAPFIQKFGPNKTWG